jgi:hypothetical protein
MDGDKNSGSDDLKKSRDIFDRAFNRRKINIVYDTKKEGKFYQLTEDKKHSSGIRDMAGKMDHKGYDELYLPDMEASIRDNMLSLLSFVRDVRKEKMYGLSAFVVSHPSLLIRFMNSLRSTIDYHTAITRWLNTKSTADIEETGFENCTYNIGTCSIIVGAHKAIIILSAISDLERLNKVTEFSLIKLSGFPASCRGKLRY